MTTTPPTGVANCSDLDTDQQVAFLRWVVAVGREALADGQSIPDAQRRRLEQAVVDGIEQAADTIEQQHASDMATALLVLAFDEIWGDYQDYLAELAAAIAGEDVA